ncbi:SHOCT domain-containing protein [Niallia sp. Sow4_A1]|uniref:SHOCT domain-containing protein n=1 Tax=Niallia hominis TaxID=3133173 RepID=A0ABV1F7M8_9BACI|nr:MULTISPECIES: SHOCT domain-containing protein [Bacillaceae]MCM3365029.1 SHOCT domain-containing protein [Niallia sp. MER TA 168]
MMGPGYFGGFGMGGGSFMMIIVILVIGVLLYLAYNHKNTGNGNMMAVQPAHNLEAFEIAKSRLASGEITVEEFEQIKKYLL